MTVTHTHTHPHTHTHTQTCINRYPSLTVHYLRWRMPTFMHQCWGLPHRLAQCTRPQGWGKLVNAALLSLINEACVNVWCATLLSSKLVGRAFRFVIRIDLIRFESIRIDSFCKKTAFQFTITGFCIMNNVFQCLWFICYLKHNNNSTHSKGKSIQSFITTVNNIVIMNQTGIKLNTVSEWAGSL